MTHVHHVAVALVFFVLAACSGVPDTPAPVVLAETVTPTPPPPLAPTPTAFQAILDDDTGLPPGAVVNGEQLGLGAEFIQICRQCSLPSRFPVELEFAAGFKEQLIPWFKFPKQDTFAFTNGDNTQLVEGFSVALKNAERQATFDDLFVAQFLPLMQQSLIEWTPDTSEIADAIIGDKSVGVTGDPLVRGFAWRLRAVAFRLGDKGAFVFTLYPAAEANPSVDVVQVAQRYADSMNK